MSKFQTRDGTPMPSISDEQERTLYTGVSSMGIIPRLSIPMDHARASSIEVNVLSAPNPPRGSILEVEFEQVLLPEVQMRTELHFPCQSDVDVRQESQVKWTADRVVFVQDNGSSVVTLVQCVADSPCIIVPFTPRFNVAYFVRVAP